MKQNEIRDKQFGDWPLPQEWLTELGRMAALWASLESFVGLAIGKLSGFDEMDDARPYILIAHSGFRQRVDIIGALCDHLLPSHPQLKGYEDVIALLKKAQVQRNRFIHNGMHPSDKDPRKMTTGRGSARGTLKFKVENIDLADLKQAVIDINEGMQALMNLVFATNYEPKWRRKAGEK